jgi:phosphoadenylyl-sulfate reductase (thioredoxin)
VSIELSEIATYLEGKPAEMILQDVVRRFPGKVTFGTGFGAEGCVIIDLIARHRLNVDLFTLDTGVHFPQTYELWHRLERHYGITIRGVKPARSIEEQASDAGPRLWERDPDRCCQLRKIEPQRAELARFDAWITALRRDQTAERAHARIYEPEAKFGVVKVNPLVSWTTKDVWNHIVKHGVPYNPLHDEGYPSIGCAPCTSRVEAGEDPRAGRWRGREKTECGLHVPARAPSSTFTQLGASRPALSQAEGA